MALSRTTLFTSLLALASTLASQSSLAHGNHEHAEGLMHVIAHFLEGLDQPLLFGSAIGVMLVAALVVKGILRRDRSE